MTIRGTNLIPMTTSGHCAYGPDHTKCKRANCTCACHIVAGIKAGINETRAIRRKRKKLI